MFLITPSMSSCVLLSCVFMEFTISLFPRNCAHLYHPWHTIIAMHHSEISGAEISGQKGFGKF